MKEMRRVDGVVMGNRMWTNCWWLDLSLPLSFFLFPSSFLSSSLKQNTSRLCDQKVTILNRHSLLTPIFFGNYLGVWEFLGSVMGIFREYWKMIGSHPTIFSVLFRSFFDTYQEYFLNQIFPGISCETFNKNWKGIAFEVKNKKLSGREKEKKEKERKRENLRRRESEGKMVYKDWKIRRILNRKRSRMKKLE